MTRTLDYAMETLDRFKQEIETSRELYQLCYTLIRTLSEFRDTEEFETALENIIVKSEKAAQVS